MVWPPAAALGVPGYDAASRPGRVADRLLRQSAPDLRSPSATSSERGCAEDGPGPGLHATDMASSTCFRSAAGRRATDCRLYARDYPGRRREPGLPVVCLHGLTRNSKDFEDVAPLIAGWGRRVIVAGRARSRPVRPRPESEQLPTQNLRPRRRRNDGQARDRHARSFSAHRWAD